MRLNCDLAHQARSALADGTSAGATLAWIRTAERACLKTSDISGCIGCVGCQHWNSNDPNTWNALITAASEQSDWQMQDGLIIIYGSDGSWTGWEYYGFTDPLFGAPYFDSLFLKLLGGNDGCDRFVACGQKIIE